jgi:hypothetical protein
MPVVRTNSSSRIFRPPSSIQRPPTPSRPRIGISAQTTRVSATSGLSRPALSRPIPTSQTQNRPNAINEQVPQSVIRRR